MTSTETLTPPRRATKQKVLSIQMCRGIAVVAVVLSHLSELERSYFGSTHTALFRMGNFGVDIFFIISGIVISMVTAGKFGSVRNAARFGYHRFARIYPIFWFYFAVALAIFLYKPNLINALKGHQVHLVRSFFLIPSGSPNLIVQAWTLSHELTFYIVFCVLIMSIRERYVPICLGLWGSGIIALGLFHVSYDNVFLALILSPFNLEFIAGCCLYYIFRRRERRYNPGPGLLAASLLWIGALAFWAFYAHKSDTLWIDEHSWNRLALYGPFAFLFIWGLLELERREKLISASSLEAVGDWSYSIYLSHLLLIAAIGRPIAHMLSASKLGFVLAYLVIVPTVLLFGFASYNWIERPLMRALYKGTPKAKSHLSHALRLVPRRIRGRRAQVS